MDMRNADLMLSNEVRDWAKAQNKRSKRNVTTRGKKVLSDENDPGFHFIAYVPIEGEIWRLDGLQEHPVNLGKFHPSLEF